MLLVFQVTRTTDPEIDFQNNFDCNFDHISLKALGPTMSELDPFPGGKSGFFCRIDTSEADGSIVSKLNLDVIVSCGLL
jgi:hypothetical protein